MPLDNGRGVDGEGSFSLRLTGFAKPLGLVWEESPVSGEVGGGWPGLGYQERARRARLGAGEVEAQPRMMALAQARGWGVVVRKVFPRARRGGGQLGLRWMGWDGMGGVPVFGPGDPRTPNTPSRAPHPRWPSWGGGGDGAREPGLGGTRCPQLSVFGAAQRKTFTFSRWEVPHMATGDPLGANPPSPGQNPPNPIQARMDYGRPAFFPHGGPAVMHLPGCTPLRQGKMKVQTVVPLWAGRHQGGGVAPGCKALAEEVKEGLLAPLIPPRARAQQGWRGAQLCRCGQLGGVPSL